MDHPAAALIAPKLGCLPHTNAHGERNQVHIPGFMRTAGTNEEYAEAAGKLGLAISEAFIEGLDEVGYEVVAKGDLKARAQELAAEYMPDSEKRPVQCNRCGGLLYSQNISTSTLVVDVEMLSLAIEAHRRECR